MVNVDIPFIAKTQHRTLRLRTLLYFYLSAEVGLLAGRRCVSIANIDPLLARV
jgi:hypothetical protein